MSDNQDIGKAFKDRLSELREAPDPNVWNRIETDLKKRKRNRFTPFWWILGSSIITIGLFVIFDNKEAQSELDHQVNNEETIKEVNKKLEQHTYKKNDSLTVDKNEKKSGNDNWTNLKKESDKGKDSRETKNNNDSSSFVKEGQIVQSSSRKNNQKIEEVSVAQNNSKSASPNSEGSNLAIEDGLNKEIPESKVSIANLGLDKEAEEDKTDLPEAVQTDSLKKKVAKVKAKPKKEAEDKGPRWYITVNSIGSFLGNFSSTSQIDPKLDGISADDPYSFNYGAYLNFENSDRFIIRLGIQKASLNSTFSGINTLDENGEKLRIQDFRNLDPINSLISDGSYDEFFDGNEEIDLIYKAQYIEVPLEGRYRLLTSKYRPSIIAGLSILFLDDNSIYGNAVNTSNFKMGSLNNMLEMNVSFNGGLGFDTTIIENLEFNAESVFKYYLKGTDQDNSDYNPFTINLHIGLNYRF